MKKQTPPEMTAEERLAVQWHRNYHIGDAMTELVKVLTARYDEDPRHQAFKVQHAQKNLIQYLAHLNGKKDFTEEEANRSVNFHTCLRKYDDTKQGTIMYRMWSEGRGELAWMTIIKNWPKGLDVICDALSVLEGSCDDVIMTLAFESWVDDGNFKPIYDLIQEWSKAEEEEKKTEEK